MLLIPDPTLLLDDLPHPTPMSRAAPEPETTDWDAFKAEYARQCEPVPEPLREPEVDEPPRERGSPSNYAPEINIKIGKTNDGLPSRYEQ